MSYFYDLSFLLWGSNK